MVLHHNSCLHVVASAKSSLVGGHVWRLVPTFATFSAIVRIRFKIRSAIETHPSAHTLVWQYARCVETISQVSLYVFSTP